MDEFVEGDLVGFGDLLLADLVLSGVIMRNAVAGNFRIRFLSIVYLTQREWWGKGLVFLYIVLGNAAGLQRSVLCVTCVGVWVTRKSIRNGLFSISHQFWVRRFGMR